MLSVRSIKGLLLNFNHFALLLLWRSSKSWNSLANGPAQIPSFDCINHRIYTCRIVRSYLIWEDVLTPLTFCLTPALTECFRSLFPNLDQLSHFPSLKQCFSFSIMHRLFVIAVSCAGLFTTRVHSCQGDWMLAFSTVWGSFEIQILPHCWASIILTFTYSPEAPGIYLGQHCVFLYSMYAFGAFLDCNQMLQAMVCFVWLEGSGSPYQIPAKPDKNVKLSCCCSKKINSFLWDCFLYGKPKA